MKSVRRQRSSGRQHSCTLRRAAARMERLEDRRMLAGESLVISEFMASNSSTLRDGFRDYSDWIEVHNPTDHSVSLDGWYLTDDQENLSKWRLPSVTIPENGYLVVFASGQDQSDPEKELHTNFRLSSTGEFIGLVRPDSTVSHSYTPQYPAQISDISYGMVAAADGARLGYFADPTPGEPNSDTATSGVASEVTFSVERGFYDQPFDVALTTQTPGAVIRYTTDGTAPTAEHGEIYAGPVTVDTTTALRAGAFGDDLLDGDVGTQTYIFLDHVLTQTGEGLPEQWGYFDDLGPPRPTRVDANYDVDPEIVNDERYADTIKDDLRSIPTLSLVLDPDDLWGFENGLYSNPQATGPRWERAVSMEMINEQGESEFQADAGLRIHGGWARRFSQTKKLSFRVHFRGEYGEPRLNYPMFGEDGQQDIKAMVLRGGFNDSWRDSGGGNNTYLQDQWTRQAQIEMGGMAPRDTYVQLYLNGMYWGLYSPTERMNAEWAASYMGGEPEEWDVLNTGGNVIDGNTREWSRLMRAVGRSTVDFDEVAGMLDVEDFIDYMIVNQYVGNWDWPHNNWYASMHNVDGAKWRFHTWDSEGAFQRGIGENRVRPTVIDDAVGPSRVYLALQPLPEFQKLYADRVAKHLLNGGLLSPEVGVERLSGLASQIDRAIVGESARWGDGRDDQGRPIAQETWARRVASINNGYFPRRGDRMISFYRDADLYPETDPPVFNQFGGHIASDTDILLTAEVPDADIYYTLDDTDPRGPDGLPSDSAIRLNTFDLVTGASDGRMLVPTGVADEVGWQAPAFDETGWTESFAAIGYETGESEDPISVPDGFEVKEYISTERINSPQEADLVLAGENLQRVYTTEGVPVLNYLGGTRGGHFDNNRNFPNGVDNFVVDAKAAINVRESGTYTFGVTSNDAARLELDGEVLFADEDRHGTRDWFVTTELSSGAHEIRVVMFDRTATGVLELYFANGQKTEFDESFQLVGDAKHRSYDSLLGTDLERQLVGINSSVYLRVPFDVPELDNVGGLFLKTQHDDGFIAYVNGVQVASRFAPDVPSFDSAATGSRFDADSIVPELTDLTEFMDLLRADQNVLAIHALNVDKSDVDMFFSPQLFASRRHAPINLDDSATLRTRVLTGGIWSAQVAAEYLTSVPASAENLRISEIHYHPRLASDAEMEAGFNDPDDFEFIEVVNIGQRAVDLSTVSFVTTPVAGEEQGVFFDFASADIRELLPGARAVIVEDLAAFQFRYGDGVPVAGQWSGGLSNAAETLTLRAGAETIHQFTYSDEWYPVTDGRGSSLEVISPESEPLDRWGNPAIWQASIMDGTPGGGSADAPGDANRDGIFDSSDLVMVFQAGEYEDDVLGNSVWEEGDWNGDGDFDSADIVLAFRLGAYVSGPAAAARPVAAFSQASEQTRINEAKELKDELLPSFGASLEDRDEIFRRWDA